MIDLVMLIDDNETDNFISKRIIEITRFAKQVEVKNSGQDALEYLSAHANEVNLLPRLSIQNRGFPGWLVSTFAQTGQDPAAVAREDGVDERVALLIQMLKRFSRRRVP